MMKDFFKEQTIYANEEPALGSAACDAIRHAVAANQPVGFLTGLYDAKLTITHVSSFMLHNLGYNYEEFMHFTQGSLRNIFYGENRDFLEEGRFQEIHGAGEGQMLTKADGPVYVQMYKEDSIDAEGRPIWILSTHIDEMHQNLHLVNEVINSGFWYLDCDENGQGKSITYSHEFRHMLGYKDILDFPNSLSSWTDSLHPDDRERATQLLAAALADKTNTTKYQLEYRLRLQNGTYQWFKDSAQITRRPDGTAVRMAGIFINVNKAHELTAQNNVYDMLISGTLKLVDRYAVCDLLNNSYKFFSRLPNDSAYAAEGKYADFVAAMSRRFKMLSDKETIDGVFEPAHLRSVISSPDAVYRIEYCTQDEKQFKSLALTPISWKNGELEKIILISQDITQSKIMEIASRMALKEAYDAATKASMAKTEFLSNMSHDIRTPMNAIVGMTAIAGANIENHDRILDCLGKITQSSRHLLGLINEVLDMSRIESGKIALNEEEFNLSDLVDNILTMTRPLIETHQHTLSVRQTQISHAAVCGDSLRIQQLLMNIISNAIKYTPDGGKIGFAVAEIPTESPHIGGYQFTIEDNGIGMSQAFQKVMFEPFTRADDKRTTTVQGTGLGMAIAQNIVNMMNGNIHVESKLGEGSKFVVTFFLKLQEADEEKITATQTAKPGQELAAPKSAPAAPNYLTDISQCDYHGKKILLVEDNALNSEIAKTIIGMTGAEIFTAANGREAVEKFIDSEPGFYDLVFMDIQMPVMNGYEATAAIRSLMRHDALAVPIIAMTANAFAEDVQLAKNAGMNEHIAKPLDMTKLYEVLKNWL